MKRFLLIFIWLSAFSWVAFSQTTDKMGYNNHSQLIPFRNKSGKWGYMNAETEQIVVKPQYDKAELFKNGYAKVFIAPQRFSIKRNHSVNYGWIDGTGKEVITPQFIYAKDANSTGSMDPAIMTNIKVVENKKGETGLLDLTTRKWVVPPGEFEDFHFYDKQHFVADGKVLFANGKRYQAPKNYRIGYVDVKNKFFYINNVFHKKGVSTWDGDIIIPTGYEYITKSDSAQRFVVFKIADSENLAGTESPDYSKEVVLYDFNGKMIARYRSTEGGYTLEDTYGVLNMGRDEDRYFKLTNGEKVSSAVVAADAGDGKGGRIVCKEDRYGVTDAEGETIIPLKYDLITVAGGTEGIDYCFKVKKGDKEGLISQNGKWLIPLKYNYIRMDRDEIGNGWVRISKEDAGDKWNLNGRGLYNIKTGVIIPPRYSRVKIHDHVINVGKIGDGSPHQLLDRKGNPITEMKYKNLQYHKSYYIGELNGKSGVLSAEGKVLVPFKHDVIFAETRDLVLAVEGGLYAPSEQKEEFYINVHTGKEYRAK